MRWCKDLKWKNFKKKVEEAGVKDDDEISYIEVWHFDFMTVEKTYNLTEEKPTGWAISD
jgi:hypothetical protein